MRRRELEQMVTELEERLYVLEHPEEHHELLQQSVPAGMPFVGFLAQAWDERYSMVLERLARLEEKVSPPVFGVGGNVWLREH